KKGTTVDKVFGKFRTNEMDQCFKNVLEQDKHVCVSFHVDITFTRLVKYGDRQGRSNLVLTTGPTFDLASSISVRKRSILYSTISRVTSACFENGLTSFWRDRTIEEQRGERFKEEKESNPEAASVGIKGRDDVHQLSARHLTGAISLYLAGLVVSSLAMTFEMTSYLARKKLSVYLMIKWRHLKSSDLYVYIYKSITLWSA
ncbi:unnamed protein product, partial [Allacma fusca]